MFAYLIKCFAILIGLWLARWYHLLPWSDLVSLVLMVIVPIVMIAWVAWRAGQRGEKRGARASLMGFRATLAAPSEDADHSQ